MPANSHFCGLLRVFERSAGARAVVLPTLVSFLAIVCTMILSPTSAHAQGPSATPIDLPPISLAPPTAANLPVDQGLRQMEDSTHRMVWALAGIVHETRRTEVDVTPNPMFVGGVGCPYPFGYDPEMLDPLESYGFDFGLDTAPTLTRDTGKLLPPRKEVVDPLVAQVTNDMNGIWSDANAIKLPDSIADDSKAQWDVLNDTLRRMQQHVQWLQDVTGNNLDDNGLIAQAAIHLHDDAAGINELAKRLLKSVAK